MRGGGGDSTYHGSVRPGKESTPPVSDIAVEQHSPAGGRRGRGRDKRGRGRGRRRGEGQG